MKIFALFSVLCAGLAGNQYAAAGSGPAVFDNPLHQARFTELIEELRCLVCQNQSLADSNAPLAHDLRNEVQRLIVSGANNDEVIAYLVERYGEFVLYRPRLTPLTWLLWSGPILLLLTGALLITRLVRRRNQQPAQPLSDEQLRQAETLLHGVGEDQ